MPFTPFPMGAGLAVKAVAERHFSVLMFGWAQVAMDLEPGAGLLLGWERLHGWSHTGGFEAPKGRERGPPRRATPGPAPG